MKKITRKEIEVGILKIHAIESEKLDQFEKIFHELQLEFNGFFNSSEAQFAF